MINIVHYASFKLFWFSGYVVLLDDYRHIPHLSYREATASTTNCWMGLKEVWTRVSNNSYLTLKSSKLAPGSPSTRNRRVVEQIASFLQSKGLPRPCSNCWCCGSSSGKSPRWCCGRLRRKCKWSPRLGGVGIQFVSCPNLRRVLLLICWCSAPS